MLFSNRLTPLFCCWLYLLAITGLKAHPGDPSKEVFFEHISVDKGLSSTSVYAITQTWDGFLWIGTQNGLNRYDGYGFKSFNFIPGNSASLSNSWVKALAVDKVGNLWVATSSGLNRYHRETESFTSYFHHKPQKNSLADNNIWNLFTDKEGTLWVGTNNGLSKYIPAKDHFVNYYIPSQPGQQVSNAINAITEDNDGNLWVGTWGSGIFKFNKETGEFRNFTDITSIQAAAGLYVKVLKYDRKGNLWIGTQDTGLHTYNPTSRQYKIFKKQAGDINSISDNGILSLLEDSRGDLWFGTHDGGINYFHSSNASFIRYQTDFLKPQSFQGHWVPCFFEDNAGNIWVGHDNGISKFNPGGMKFQHFKNNPFDENSVPNSNISLLYEDNQGIIWIGTWGASLSKYDRQKDTFTHYKHDPANKRSISDRRIWGICEDAEKNLWVATSSGMDRLDRKTGTFTHFNDIYKDNPAAQIGFPALSSTAIDNKNRFWIGTWGGGIYIHDPQNKTTTHVVHNPDDSNSPSNDRIKHIFIDSHQNIWVSTSEGGLDKIVIKTDGSLSFRHFRYEVSQTQSIGSDSPQIVFEDSKQRIWVGTEGGGLSFYNPGTDDFQRVHIRQISSILNSVYGILEDEAGNLWLSTNNGIIHYNPVSGHGKGYDITDGLQGNTFLSGHCQTKDGAMLFGGHNGFNLFYPQRITESTFKPPVLISELRIFNEVIEPGRAHKNTYAGESPVLSRPLYLSDEINLSYKDYILSFSFTCLDFTAPHKNKFAFMMENFEDEWNFTDGSKRFATYTNLPPGEYIFKVKGTNSDGLWNQEPAAVKLIITPPFWQTWWFRTLFISIILVIVYSLHRLWLQVKFENLLAMERVKAQEAEAIRKRVAMDFHDEMGNQLASITAIVNLINIRQSKKEYYIEDLLSRLTQHAQTLFYGTKDFIWSIDPKSDKAEVILLNIKDFGEDLFDRTGISFHFSKDIQDPGLTFPSGASRHITLICKEVFTNIVKHAHCQTVQVRAIADDDQLRISIKDDGCGFDRTLLKKNGNGLENMRSRARKINADISIESHLNQGTEIVLTILIPRKGEDKKKLILDFSN
ncbi:hypothetical protein GXP67_23485 [Rhodocytophaga rosea]|uniref:Histidine kinase/HSP90-like ATPase domain-containing protein n=1 Tax=Rhodocytophaga rosea TaxID=2704465 RepID=A0A6C0GP36_9BACT|nr:sensor histidine kinase [Rhodocytophaga rosea]QHT69390.1 hypothetical protein GXP67_23485 [Rhodocytophaga rosea]